MHFKMTTNIVNEL